MKNDYLWDKTGEPDAEIQELERVLGTLKYQPRPLEIPDSLRTARPRFFMPASIAAGVALALLSLGLWFGLNRRQEAPVVKAPGVEQNAPVIPVPRKEEVVTSAPTPIKTSLEPGTSNPRPRHVTRRRSAVNSAQLAEAKKAKEQLLLALRLASSKLNLAQKRTQGAPPANQIRNQHKVG